ncbi:MAG: alpha-galactosidase, partial [Acetatifactor sp.]|nr:alpha-galactosidase [Acetatifactor sp.]
MSISFNESEKVFRLDTPNSTYLIGIVDEKGFLGHIYYGKRIPDDNMQYLMRLPSYPETPAYSRMGDQISFLDSLPTEYPGNGLGDFRESCFSVETKEGYRACGITYQSHRIFGGKPKLPGLPATYGEKEDCTTLEITCRDEVLNLTVILYYTAFEKIDAICRSVCIKNESKEEIKLTRVLSACLDMDNRDFDIITLHGAWSSERNINRRKLSWGKQGVSSMRGISSHQEQPFMALAEESATQTHGQVYAMNLVYSGNFTAQAQMSQQEYIRMVMGINPEGFCWTLKEGESFQAPEAVLVYSDTGLNGMTHAFHDLYRGHLVRGPYKDKARPSLVNNWEATYFQFDTQKLLDIAKTAADAGIEMLVMDDGWFGHRDDDTTSLGDWYVNEEKLSGGLKYLVDEVNKLGLRFGIWFEPEMVSPKSDLYRAHPDYALQIPGREGTLGRNQMVLDISRKEVRDCIYDQMYKVLSSANIEYVKWDMNRALTDVASFSLASDRQGELYHRYVLGVYEMQERLISDFPNLLLENCCSGGGRFDAGMLYYSPQIWTSDNTEAIDRLRIQEGTALIYPLSSMGAHVAVCPSHTNRRVTPFDTRGLVS